MAIGGADPTNKDLIKQLRIKSGAVKRTKNEYEYYQKEEAQQRQKVEQMRAESKDPSDIKQQAEVLNETLTVLPDARSRLEKFANELQQFLDQKVPGDLDLSQGGDLQTLVTDAQQLLKESADHLPA